MLLELQAAQHLSAKKVEECFFCHGIVDWVGVRRDLKDCLVPTPLP